MKAQYVNINYPLPVTVTYFGHFWKLTEEKQNSKLRAYGHGEDRGQKNVVLSIITFIIHVRTVQERTLSASFYATV
jgi:hypothetical protein